MEERWFWALLSAGIWGKEPRIDGLTPLTAETWREVVRLANSSGTTGLLVKGIEMLPAEMRPPKPMVMKLLLTHTGYQRSHIRHNAALHKLMGMLREMDVEPVLLKGQGAAINFIDPTSRSCGDIDLYIGVDKTDHLIAKLKERGITCDEEIDDNEKHAVFYYDNLGVELHRHSTFMNLPKANSIYQQWWDEGCASDRCEALYVTADGRMLSEPEPGCEKVTLPTPEHGAFFLFYHVYHHFTSLIVQFRQFADVARHLHTHRHSIDRPALEAKLNELGLMHAWQSVGCFLHIYLGMDTDDIPFYDSSKEHMAEKIAKRLRKKVLYHRESKWKRPKGRISSKLYSYIHYFGVAWELLPIFPKESTAYLLQTTTQGLKILFRKANRTGTREHYLQRNSQEQSQE